MQGGGKGHNILMNEDDSEQHGKMIFGEFSFEDALFGALTTATSIYLGGQFCT
jgi:hypothetical protein